MDARKTLAGLVALALTTAMEAGATGTAKPTKTVTRIDHSTVIPAGETWNSPTRFDEKCGFDLAIDFDSKFITWQFSDHEVIEIVIADRYRNLKTGFSFIDRARYHIYFDYASSRAFHAGTFWKVDVPGPGIEVRDVGTFVQNWDGPFPWPVIELTGGPHEINSKPFGTFSYCDWAQKKFP